MMLGEFVKVLIKYSETDSMVVVTDHLQNQPSRGVLRKGLLKMCHKFTGEHPCRSAISIKLQGNFTLNVM